MRHIPKELVAEQSVFKTLVVEEPAKIVPANGMFGLVRYSNNKMYTVPPGINITAQFVNTNCAVIFRCIEDRAILNKGPDDVFEEELKSDDNIMVVDNVHDFVDILNEAKLRVLSSFSNTVSAFIAGLCMVLSCIFLISQNFAFPMVLNICMVAGIVVLLFFGLLPMISLVRVLTSSRVYDSVGNFVDTKTGVTSLNGGMTINFNKGDK